MVVVLWSLFALVSAALMHDDPRRDANGQPVRRTTLVKLYEITIAVLAPALWMIVVVVLFASMPYALARDLYAVVRSR